MWWSRPGSGNVCSGAYSDMDIEADKMATENEAAGDEHEEAVKNKEENKDNTIVLGFNKTIKNLK